jgi:hypothetical protein
MDNESPAADHWVKLGRRADAGLAHRHSGCGWCLLAHVTAYCQVIEFVNDGIIWLVIIIMMMMIISTRPLYTKSIHSTFVVCIQYSGGWALPWAAEAVGRSPRHYRECLLPVTPPRELS